jgi:hypothetical protein
MASSGRNFRINLNFLFSDDSVIFKNDRAAAKAAYMAGGFPSQYDVFGINLMATSFEQ